MFLFLLVTAVTAASKCGKRSLRSKYGKQTTFQSAQQKSTCKYRIRTTRGLHVKLVFNNYQAEPCCQVTISPRGKNSEKLPIPAGPRASLVVKASDVNVIIKSSSAARAVNISHEAVLPDDGDFGFAFRATKKFRVIRSPTFPKTKLPSGVRSLWNVTASQGRNIQIDITGLSTSANQDFLEIFDGTVSLGRYSGKKKKKQMPITHRALSGNMVIVLETRTGQSKGFRAKIVAKEVEGSAQPETTNGTKQTIQCHKRTRLTSNGGVISDEQSRMTCNNGEVCGRMLVEGSTMISGTNLPVTSETLHCIPQSLCTGNCGEISMQEESIIVNSCELSCCSTDMCNKSPDALDVPIPATGSTAPFPFWLTPPGGLLCNEGSSVRRESGVGIGSGSGGDTCRPGSVCALYVFSGVSNDTTMEKVVGYVTKCTPEAECIENSCSNLEEARDVNLSYCNSTCCKTDYCNDPYETTIPTLPTREPIATSCSNIKGLRIGNDTQTDDKYYTSCDEVETRCLRVDAYVKNSDGKHGVASFGKCIAKSSCDNLDCSSLLGLDESITATSCVAKCCDNDMCNERPMRVPVPSGEENGLWCHSQSVIVQEGAVQYYGERTNVLCNDGEVCAYLKFFGTSTEYHQVGEPMAGYGAMCQPRSACNENTCQTLPNAKDVKVTSCEATCCNTSMCNEPGEAPMPSPRTPVKGFSGQCYTILQTSMNGGIVMNQTSVSTCSAGSVCLRIDADTVYAGLAVKVAYGSCIPKISCNFANCDAVNRTMPGIPIRDCRIHCCDTELCNNQPAPVPSVTAPAVHPSPSESSSMGSSESGGSQETSRCYDTLQMRSYGVLLPGSKKDAVSCEPNSQCFKLSTVASHSSLPGATVKTTIGGCAPKATCAARNCASNPAPAMVGTVVESCEASCCDGDLCNM